MTIVFSPQHQLVIDAGRALLTQKILREAETVEVLHEMHLNGDAENIRLAEEAHRHAALMTNAAMLECYLDMKAVARDEIEAEMHQVRVA